IRDDLVTGVQTCALPIWISRARGARLPTRRAMEETLYSLSIPAPTLFRWSAERGAGLRRHRVGHRGYGARHDHDARTGLLLRWSRAAEEPRLDDRPVPGHLRRREFGVVDVGIHAGPGPVLQRVHRKLRRFRSQQRGCGIESRVFGHNPCHPLFRVSTDVRLYHALT